MWRSINYMYKPLRVLVYPESSKKTMVHTKFLGGETDSNMK